MGGPCEFSHLPLSRETLTVLKGLGLGTATPVQEATIPLFCGNKDVAVDACTGSGKTLAFVIPVVEKLRKLEQRLRRGQVGAIIVSPTRELARQIHGVAEPFVASVPWLTSRLLVGGTNPAEDAAALLEGGGHVLVGTPGRIDDVLKRCGTAVDLKCLEVLVLDEADRLLDMGFKAQLDAIMARLPRQRRTGLFSATQTEAVEALARAGLRNPVRVAVAVTGVPSRPPAGAAAGGPTLGPAPSQVGAPAAEAALPAAVAEQRTPSTLRLEYMVCENDEKLAQLAAFLSPMARSLKVICYFLTCASVEWHALALQYLGANLGPAHSGQQHRLPKRARQQQKQQLEAAAATSRSEDAHEGPAAAPNGLGEGGRHGPSTTADGDALLPTLLAGVEVRALHGKMKQAARESTLASFAALPAGVLLATDVAARGLDIPDVAWVVQFEPPQDPAAFVHRVGRTARMGRSGAALALLLPHEVPYVDFLRLRKVPLREATQALAQAPRGIPAFLQHCAEKDRDLMERGLRAFVSIVRAYKEHHCSYIFRLQDLDLGRLATSLALLRLPRMPEIKKAQHRAAAAAASLAPPGGGKAGLARSRLPRQGADATPATRSASHAPAGSLPGFTPSSVDPDTVPYRDRARERQRKQALTCKLEAREARSAVAAVEAAASAKRARAAAEVSRLPAAKRRQLQERDELSELARDYALLRKLRAGKISEHQFDVATGLSSGDEAEAASEEEGTAGGMHKRQRAQRRRGLVETNAEDGEAVGGPGGSSTAAQQERLASRGSIQQQRGRTASTRPGSGVSAATGVVSSGMRQQESSLLHTARKKAARKRKRGARRECEAAPEDPGARATSTAQPPGLQQDRGSLGALESDGAATGSIPVSSIMAVSASSKGAHEVAAGRLVLTQTPGVGAGPAAQRKKNN